ncbi:Nucleic acid-binding, OB-fold containing protein [Melia azedarach]|uniref:Nucleic acid-binding, OB-fold containing protein n=1 Tax=Melia azedarach TaxID=155640 RepID=A0ACC1YNM3_MELAZ|nr:Nucleic acid-binding, OB-fold containing protein [Melia azedarach]
MEGDKPTTVMCTVVGMDQTSFCYRVCSFCERTLPDNPSSLCKFCNFNSTPNSNSVSSSKRLFRLLISIATDTKVKMVICFDRAARVLFGCSADCFLDFAQIHPFAAMTASKVLQGEMFKMTLNKPKNGNAQHLRVATVVPLSSSFRPVIEILREKYGERSPRAHFYQGAVS